MQELVSLLYILKTRGNCGDTLRSKIRFYCLFKNAWTLVAIHVLLSEMLVSSEIRDWGRTCTVRSGSVRANSKVRRGGNYCVSHVVPRSSTVFFHLGTAHGTIVDCSWTWAGMSSLGLCHLGLPVSAGANWNVFTPHPAAWCWHKKEEVCERAPKLCWSAATQPLLQSFGFSHLPFLSAWYLQHLRLSPKTGHILFLQGDVDSMSKARGWELEMAFSLPVSKWQTWRPLVPSNLLVFFFF